MPDPRYCPFCSGPLSKIKEGEAIGRLGCILGCQKFIWYNNPLPVAVALVPVNTTTAFDSLILVKRPENSSLKDKWCMPAGFVNEREHPREAVVREVKEEVGIDVEVSKSVGVYISRERNRLVHAYWCRWPGLGIGELFDPSIHHFQKGSDAADVGIFTKENLPPIAFPIHEEIIGNYFGGKL